MRRRLPSKEPVRGAALLRLLLLSLRSNPHGSWYFSYSNLLVGPPHGTGLLYARFFSKGRDTTCIPSSKRQELVFVKPPSRVFFKGIPPSLRIHVSLLRIGYKKSLFCLYPVRCPPHGFF